MKFPWMDLLNCVSSMYFVSLSQDIILTLIGFFYFKSTFQPYISVISVCETADQVEVALHVLFTLNSVYKQQWWTEIF